MSTSDVATLVLRVDSSQLNSGATALLRVESAAARAEAQATRTSTAFGSLAGKFAAAIAAFKIADFARDSALLAARYETMGVVMKIAGNNAGYTKEQMDAFSKSLEASGISMLQSRNILTQLSTANIDLAKAQALGRAAQDLGVVANINSSEALERLTHGIVAGEIEIVRNLGLQVSWEAGYKKLAAQLGTTSDKLTEQQKVVSRTNTVIQEATKYNGIYEESMGTAGKAMTSLTRYWEDFKVKVGEVALPALADAVFSLTDALKAGNNELDKSGSDGTVSSIGKGLAAAFTTVKETVLVLGANVSHVFSAIGREIGAIGAQAVALSRFDFTAFGGIREALLEDNAKASKSLTAFENSVMKVGKGNATQMEESMANARLSSKKTEEQRIAEGKAFRKSKEEEEALLAKKPKGGGGGGGGKGSSPEIDAYNHLTKAIYEKTAATALEDDGTRKLTESENTRARVLYDLTTGQIKLTAAHRNTILTKLDALVVAEREKENAIAYGKAMKSMDDTVVNADDSTRELDAAQKVLLETMRQPEWERMPVIWQQTVIAQTQSASEMIKVSQWQAKLNDLQRQTPSVALEKSRETMIKLADEYERGTFGLMGSAEAMTKYSEVVDVALGRSSEGIQKQSDALDKFAEAAATNMQKTMSDFLFDPFAQGTKGMAEAFGTAVRKMIADAVAADLGKRLFGDLGSGGSAGGIFEKALSFLTGGSGASMSGAGSATENWIDSGGLSSGVGGLGSSLLNWISGLVPKFDVGTSFVPRDMLAVVHRGEEIIPASRAREDTRSGGDTYNLKLVLPEGSSSQTKISAAQGARQGFAYIKQAKRYQ